MTYLNEHAQICNFDVKSAALARWSLANTEHWWLNQMSVDRIHLSMFRFHFPCISLKTRLIFFRNIQLFREKKYWHWRKNKNTKNWHAEVDWMKNSWNFIHRWIHVWFDKKLEKELTKATTNKKSGEMWVQSNCLSVEILVLKFNLKDVHCNCHYFNEPLIISE